MVTLRQLHEKYSDRAQFLFVYIRDAGHELPEAMRSLAEEPDVPAEPRVRRRKREFVIPRPRLLKRARAGRKFFGLHFPCLLDNEDKEVELQYTAFPKRMLVVDPAGRIVVDSGHFVDDPFPWEEVTYWLDRYGPSR